jgi:hypothetical protein
LLGSAGPLQPVTANASVNPTSPQASNITGPGVDAYQLSPGARMSRRCAGHHAAHVCQPASPAVAAGAAEAEAGPAAAAASATACCCCCWRRSRCLRCCSVLQLSAPHCSACNLQRSAMSLSLHPGVCRRCIQHQHSWLWHRDVKQPRHHWRKHHHARHGPNDPVQLLQCQQPHVSAAHSVWQPRHHPERRHRQVLQAGTYTA